MAAISRSRNIIDFNSNGGVTVFFNYGRYKQGEIHERKIEYKSLVLGQQSVLERMQFPSVMRSFCKEEQRITFLELSVIDASLVHCRQRVSLLSCYWQTQLNDQLKEKDRQLLNFFNQLHGSVQLFLSSTLFTSDILNSSLGYRVIIFMGTISIILIEWSINNLIYNLVRRMEL